MEKSRESEISHPVDHRLFLEGRLFIEGRKVTTKGTGKIPDFSRSRRNPDV